MEIESIGRPLWQHQKKSNWEEPSYELPHSSTHQDQEDDDEGQNQTQHRKQRYAPPSTEKDRKIIPFSKKPITFMHHATYGNQLGRIMSQGLKPGKSSTPRGRPHVHMACIDDVIFDDESCNAALTHAPKGRDALLILAFTENNAYNIRLTEERTALTEHTIDPCNIIAAFNSDIGS